MVLRWPESWLVNLPAGNLARPLLAGQRCDYVGVRSADTDWRWQMLHSRDELSDERRRPNRFLYKIVDVGLLLDHVH